MIELIATLNLLHVLNNHKLYNYLILFIAETYILRYIFTEYKNKIVSLHYNNRDPIVHSSVTLT